MPKYKKTFPDVMHKEIMGKMSTEWKGLPASKKAPMEKAFEHKKAEWRKAMEALPEEVKMDLLADRRAKTRTKQLRNANSELKAMLVTQGKPKRPMNGYMHFSIEKRKTVEAMSVADGARVVASQWKAMSEQQRAPYEKMAADEKVQHEKDMKRWTAKMERKGLMEAIEVAKSKVSALKKD